MSKTTLRSRAAFTLIELLTVIAIIGILAAILFPAIGAAKKAASKSNDLANIRSIGQAALTYANDNDNKLPDPQNTSLNKVTGGTKYLQWFGMLAAAGNLTDPKIVYSKLEADSPTTVVTAIIDPTDSTKLDSSFSGASQPPSYDVVGGLKGSDVSTSPIAITRGLTTAGIWDSTAGDAKLGVYGTDGGGMIVFIGGNVSQYKKIDLTANPLIAANGKPTIDITQTVLKSGTRAFYGDATKSAIGSATGTSPSTGP